MSFNCVILTTTSNGEGLENYTYDNKNYDLFIIDYTSQKNQSPLNNNKYKFVFESEGGYKYHNIKRLLESSTIMDDYEYIWFPDWDISFNPNDLNNLFTIAKEYDLDICQPSLSEDSHISWKITQHNPNTKVRLTNFVEVMCPLFKSSFLKEVLWTLNLNYSSWGLDFLWGSLAKENKMGIIDSIVVKHERPVASHEWLLPNNQNANQELEELQNKYNLILNPQVFKALK
jgi:hypothetical protein